MNKYIDNKKCRIALNEEAYFDNYMVKYLIGTATYIDGYVVLVDAKCTNIIPLSSILLIEIITDEIPDKQNVNKQEIDNIKKTG